VTEHDLGHLTVREKNAEHGNLGESRKRKFHRKFGGMKIWEKSGVRKYEQKKRPLGSVGNEAEGAQWVRNNVPLCMNEWRASSTQVTPYGQIRSSSVLEDFEAK